MKKLIGVLLAVVLVALSVIPSSATVGYLVSPVVRFWDTTGTRILTGGYVVTCQTGATCGCTSFTSLTTYTDSTGLVANTNPVYLDSTGSASIWYAGNAKITICDRFGNLQWSRDNVATTTLQTELSVNEWPTLSSAIPTYISASQFSVAGDFTSILTVGRRLKLTQTSGEIYVTITASAYASGVTTITVISDTVGVDSGIASIAIGIMEPTYPSLPIQPTVHKTAGYTITAVDCGKTFIASLSSASTFTLPAASAVPSGCRIVTKNTGTYILTIGGTVDSASNPQLSQYEAMAMFSTGLGTAWRGGLETKADRTIVFGNSFVSATVTSTPTGTSIPVSRADGTLDPGWIHAFYTVETFTVTSVWTAPAGVSDIWLFLRGGGGGGGGGQSADPGSAGGGGGAGNLLAWHRYPVVSGSTYTITIGTGSAGGAATAAGTDGVTTSFIKTDGTGTVSVAGGSGGAAGAGGTGGAGGSPISTIVSSISTTTNIGFGLYTSSTGYTGTAASAGASTPGGTGGTGGGIAGGAGGAGCTPGCAGNAGSAAIAATGSGGGGGGSGNTGGAGGAGSNGYAVILYF